MAAKAATKRKATPKAQARRQQSPGKGGRLTARMPRRDADVVIGIAEEKRLREQRKPGGPEVIVAHKSETSAPSEGQLARISEWNQAQPTQAEHRAARPVRASWWRRLIDWARS